MAHSAASLSDLTLADLEKMVMKLTQATVSSGWVSAVTTSVPVRAYLRDVRDVRGGVLDKYLVGTLKDYNDRQA